SLTRLAPAAIHSARPWQRPWRSESFRGGGEVPGGRARLCPPLRPAPRKAARELAQLAGVQPSARERVEDGLLPGEMAALGLGESAGEGRYLAHAIRCPAFGQRFQDPDQPLRV